MTLPPNVDGFPGATHARLGRWAGAQCAWSTALVVWVGVLALLGGCNANPDQLTAQPPPEQEQVDAINLWVRPMAVNLDQEPGPDAVQAQVYFFRYDRKLPVTVKGTLEMVLYDGVVQREQLDKAPPLRTWRLSGDELRGLLFRSGMGWAYNLQLPWGANVPTAASVTLVARYVPPAGGPPLTSSPSVISLPRPAAR